FDARRQANRWHWRAAGCAVGSNASKPQRHSPEGGPPGMNSNDSDQPMDAADKVPEQFQDRTTERTRSLPAPVRVLMLLMSAAGIAISVVYIFGLLPLLDVTYYYLLMAMFLPQAYLQLPAYRKERGVTWASY